MSHPATGELPADLDRLELSLLHGMMELQASQSAPPEPGIPVRGLDPGQAAELLEAQIDSRLVDHTARWLRSEHGIGYYTIGSAGHESNGAVALALRPTDPALLHYRSGGFYFARASQLNGSEGQQPQDPVGDLLRGMLALTTDQISGGRHKVFGSKALAIIPQTSTIGSHLPRAVGLAVAIGWGRADGSDHSTADSPAADSSKRWPADSVVVCSFGDASLNHSSAQGAINWACHTAVQGHPVPMLFVCEDNGLGISVPTPKGWVESSTRERPGLLWAAADGDDPDHVFVTSGQLIEQIRLTGRPGFLHLRTVRFLGHAGTDVESAYRSPAAIRVDLDRDPILGTARLVVDAGICSGHDVAAWYLERRDQVRHRALALADEPEISSPAEVMTPLKGKPDNGALQRVEHLLAGEAGISVSPARPAGGGDGPTTSLTLAQTINRALAMILDRSPTSLVFGEDVGRKGGVYGVTRGLQNRFGEDRVFDTILDEQSILGLALGSALNGFLPIPEIQYLAYLHNAEDQLRGEAATLSFFSNRQFVNPMVIRIAAYAYQQGFGGHFHNDNSVAVLRDIPGIVIASPSHPSDAAAMLAACVALAEAEGTVCAFLEPIARYHTTHLHIEGDEGWTSPLVTSAIPIGSARVHGSGTDGTILTWGNGLYLSLRAQQRLREDFSEQWRVVDLRWLAPLPVDDLLMAAQATGRVLVVDETRHSGGVGEAVVAALLASGFRGTAARISALDSFIPLGAAASLVLLDEDQIVQAARAVGRG